MYPLHHESKCPSGQDQNDTSNQQLVGTVDRSESISSFTSACHIIPYLGRYLFHQKKRPTSSNPTSSISPNNFFPKSSTLIIAYLIPPPHNQRTHARSQQQRESKKIEFLHALGRRRRRRNEERKQQDRPNLKDGADIRSFPRLRTAVQNQHSPDRQSAQISREGLEGVHTQGITAIQL